VLTFSRGRGGGGKGMRKEKSEALRKTRDSPARQGSVSE